MTEEIKLNTQEISTLLNALSLVERAKETGVPNVIHNFLRSVAPDKADFDAQFEENNRKLQSDIEEIILLKAKLIRMRLQAEIDELL